MIKTLRNCFAFILAMILISLGFARRASNRAFNSNYITPLYFHNPSRKLFEKCIKWLIKNSYVFISTDELVEILNKKKPPVKGAVWVSLDDGWKNNIADVIPVALENNVPLIIFISTGPVEGDGVFWWTYAEQFRNQLPFPYNRDINLLWNIPESDRKSIIDELVKNQKKQIRREAMTVNDVRDLAKIPLVTIGNHTVNHVITPNCNMDELESEIFECNKKLEEWTGRKITYFSYPNGDFNGKEPDILKKNNIILAATAENKLITPEDKLYFLPRFSVSEGPFFEEICHMTGIWKPFIKKIKSFFTLKIR